MSLRVQLVWERKIVYFYFYISLSQSRQFYTRTTNGATGLEGVGARHSGYKPNICVQVFEVEFWCTLNQIKSVVIGNLIKCIVRVLASLKHCSCYKLTKHGRQLSNPNRFQKAQNIVFIPLVSRECLLCCYIYFYLFLFDAGFWQLYKSHTQKKALVAPNCKASPVKSVMSFGCCCCWYYCCCVFWSALWRCTLQ